VSTHPIPHLTTAIHACLLPIRLYQSIEIAKLKALKATLEHQGIAVKTWFTLSNA